MYNYETQKKNLFTEEGMTLFFKISKKVDELLETAGAFQMSKIFTAAGDTWSQQACVDHLVSLGELKEVTDKNKVMGQYRVFVKAYKGD